MNTPLHRILTVAIVLLLGLPGLSGVAKAQSIETKWDGTQLVERSISAGDQHKYVVELAENEFLFLTVNQRGADVEIATFDAQGEKLGEFDTNNGQEGPEIVTYLPSSAGSYTFIVRSIDEGSDSGKYNILPAKRMAAAGNPSDRLRQVLRFWETQGYLPGFAVSVVTKDKILYQEGFGYADLSAKRRYTPATIQNIGSISKTLIGVCLMRLVDEGTLNLSTPVNDILPFQVINPHHPEIPITVEQLALHTSSIAEMDAYEKSYVLTEDVSKINDDGSDEGIAIVKGYQDNVAMPLGDFLRAVLAKDGQLYNEGSYLKTAPGEIYEYSNVAAALAAYVVELKVGASYADYTRKLILKPLGMKSSGWRFVDVDMNRHSNLYFSDHQVIPKYTLNTYPDGGLITSAAELSLYLMEMMRGYAGDSQLLKPKSFQTLMTNRLPSDQERPMGQGLFWEIRPSGELGHSGGDPGTVNLLRFDPATGIGRVLMANVLPEDPMALKQFQTIWRLLDEFAEPLVKHHP